MLAATVDERGASIEVQGALPQVRANTTRLILVLSNLLGNALKFVGPGVKPQILVTSEIMGPKVRVSFQDNGIGIANEYHRQIFKMFERLHTVSEFPGTGVGLAIVHRAMSRLAGSVGVESSAGKGSTFWIELPLA